MERDDDFKQVAPSQNFCSIKYNNLVHFVEKLMENLVVQNTIKNIAFFLSNLQKVTDLEVKR